MGGADGRKEDDARGVLQIEQAGGQGHVDAAAVLVHFDDELVHQRDERLSPLVAAASSSYMRNDTERSSTVSR